MDATSDSFSKLDETQQAAVLTYAKTRCFLDDTPKEQRKQAILIYAEKLAEDAALVARLTQVYQAKRANDRNPLAILGSFGF